MADESRAALVELMSHEDRVRAFFLRHVDEYDADDLTQETLFAAWRALAGFRRDSSLGTWLHGIAKRVLWNHYRASASRLREIDVAGELAVGSPHSESDRVTGIALEIALGLLSREDCELYESFYRQRLCIRQIAKVSGEPEGTVKYRLFTLRERLRKRLL